MPPRPSFHPAADARIHVRIWGITPVLQRVKENPLSNVNGCPLCFPDSIANQNIQYESQIPFSHSARAFAIFFAKKYHFSTMSYYNLPSPHIPVESEIFQRRPLLAPSLMGIDYFSPFRDMVYLA